MLDHQRGHGDHRPTKHARAMPPTATTAGWLHRPLPRERPHLTRCTKIVCSAFLTLLLVAGVLLFVAYLTVRPHRPRFHVTAFSAAGIQQAGATTGVLLSGQLSIRNPNQDVAFFYDRLYMSVLYRQYGAVVKDHDLAGGAPMYQPPKTTSPLAFEGVAVLAGPATADMARAAAEAGGAVEFTVKVRSRIRAKVAVWGFHWHPLHVDCDVAVGPDGQLLPEARQKRCGIDFL